ncbi:MAG: hypothetical protein J7483_06525 [Novosphingobium sp.]|nr:hypothetical protein [Novosphingobium sp.]
MNRVRQTFTNKLSEPIVIWVELDCWCWTLAPGESLTAEFDEKGYGNLQPLPLELSCDGVGDAKRLTMTLCSQGGRLDLWIGDQAVLVDDQLTPYGESRYGS